MSGRLGNQYELVGAYLDGTLDDAQRAEFERAMLMDQKLKAEVEFQRRLDSSLTRLFEHEAAGAAVVEAPVVAGRIGPSQRRYWWLSAAAAVLVVAAVAYFVYQPRDPNMLSPEQVYARMEQASFTPAWKCKDDAEFIATVEKRLGEGLLVPAETPGLQVVGWAYAGAYLGYPISPDSMVLITKKGDDNVLLFIDRTGSDRHLKEPGKATGLHLFRDTAGGLVLYEVTPRSEPVVIPIAKANKPG